VRYFYSRIFLLTALKYYSILVVPNPDMKEELEAISKRTVHAIPLAVNSTEPSSASVGDESLLRNLALHDRKPLIVTVGGFVFSKGVDRVLGILPTLVKNYPNLTYIAAGTKRDPAYFRYLQDRVRSQGLSDYVLFLPDADANVVKALYTACDVYVQPSYEEGFCLTVLQALLADRNGEKPFALVGSRTGEIPRMMELAGMSELLFEAFSSPPALERSLQLALTAVTSGSSTRNGRQQIVSTYSWRRIAERTYTIYERVAASK
jgi:glycosyltransferase involved in cell wall biosynthesis